VAVRKKGLDELPAAIQAAEVSHFHVAYDAIIETAISHVEELLLPATSGCRSRAVLALASDEPLPDFPRESVGTLETIRKELAAHYRQPLVYVINQQRLRCVNCIVNVVYRKHTSAERSLGDRFGDLAIHPFWGWLILLGVLFGIYQFVGVLGAGTMVDFIESRVFGEWILPTVTSIVNSIIPFEAGRAFFVGEYGLFTMALSYGIAIVLPIVTTFFLAFSILEDSGYLARLAVMANRPFKAMGLNGKAVLPMVLGLGCDTMATMTTRIMETRKERLQVMLLLALGVPCSAQLGAILGMVSFISMTGMLVWAGVVVGVLLTVGYLSSKIIPGDSSDFIVELPPIRTPKPGSIIIKTLARLEWYMKEVLPLFILGTTLLFVLDGIGGLTLLERLAAPLVGGLLGLPRETTSAFLIGFLRRDYGAAGLFVLAREGALTNVQVVVSLVVITLFVPCIANFLMIIKEFGWRTAAAVTAFIVPFAFLVGGALNTVATMLNLKF
jgi:ferrous iron transport protein B